MPWDNPSPTDGARILPSSGGRGGKSDETKFAEKLIKALDAHSFSPDYLARVLVYMSNDYMRGRLLDLAKALIHALAFQHTISDDAVTQESYRIYQRLGRKTMNSRQP